MRARASRSSSRAQSGWKQDGTRLDTDSTATRDGATTNHDSHMDKNMAALNKTVSGAVECMIKRRAVQPAIKDAGNATKWVILKLYARPEC